MWQKNKYQRKYFDYTEHVSPRATVSLKQSWPTLSMVHLLFRTPIISPTSTLPAMDVKKLKVSVNQNVL